MLKRTKNEWNDYRKDRKRYRNFNGRVERERKVTERVGKEMIEWKRKVTEILEK